MEEAGFRKHQSCVDLFNTLIIILEQSAEWQTTLYLTFIDFEKAFDSLNRRLMWKTLSEYGIPQKILNLIKEMYELFRFKLLHEEKLTENFIINTCVRQGCILSPIIFLLVRDKIMRNILGGRKRGIQWNMTDKMEDLEFADDICLLARRLIDMKKKLKRLQGDAELNSNVRNAKEMRVNVTTITQKLSNTQYIFLQSLNATISFHFFSATFTLHVSA
jgi:hypothetical protein